MTDKSETTTTNNFCRGPGAPAVWIPVVPTVVYDMTRGGVAVPLVVRGQTTCGAWVRWVPDT